MTIEEEYYSPEYYHPMGEDVGFYALSTTRKALD